MAGVLLCKECFWEWLGSIVTRFGTWLDPGDPMGLLRFWLTLVMCFLVVDQGYALRPMPDFEPAPLDLARLNRTLQVLHGKPNGNGKPRLRVLFYGQSITLQGWWVSLSNWMITTYPGVEFEIENRAISGFEAEQLATTAETDVIPFAPDLIILHCYGQEAGMDKLLRLLRERTVADVVVQQDHPHLAGQLREPTDPAVIPQWDWWAQRNYVWLPRLCERHGCCLARVRDIWKAYLTKHGLFEAALMADSTHPNSEGNQVITASLIEYLRREPLARDMDPEDSTALRVRTLELQGISDPWTVTVDFSGTRLEAGWKVEDSASARPFNAQVRIDGVKPSELPGTTRFGRPSSCLGRSWPALFRIGSRASLVEEAWRVTLTEVGPEGGWFKFRLDGSVTGDDGEGVSYLPFVSRSGRVSIEPADWVIPFAAKASREIPPVGFTVEWRSEFLGTDWVEEWNPSGRPGESGSRHVTLVSGLEEGPHRVQLISQSGHAPTALRFWVQSAARKAALAPRVRVRPTNVTGLMIRKFGDRKVVMWPSAGLGHRLEWTESLGRGGDWKPLEPEDGTVEGVLSRELDSSVEMGFFRLIVP